MKVHVQCTNWGGVSIKSERGYSAFKTDLATLMSNTGLSIGYKNNKAIVYNTNYTWWYDFSERWILFRAGFRKVAGYRGHRGNKVSVMLKKI